MKNLKILIVLIFLLFINGCHTHLHFTPSLNTKLHVNEKTKDSIEKKDSISIKKTGN
jgi:hypothetical protein